MYNYVKLHVHSEVFVQTLMWCKVILSVSVPIHYSCLCIFLPYFPYSLPTCYLLLLLCQVSYNNNFFHMHTHVCVHTCILSLLDRVNNVNASLAQSPASAVVTWDRITFPPSPDSQYQVVYRPVSSTTVQFRNVSLEENSIILTEPRFNDVRGLCEAGVWWQRWCGRTKRCSATSSSGWK